MAETCSAATGGHRGNRVTVRTDHAEPLFLGAKRRSPAVGDRTNRSNR